MALDGDAVLEKIVKDLGVAIPGMGRLEDHLRLSDELQIDSLRFILFILKIEAEVGRKVFDSGSIGALKTIGDIRRKLGVGPNAEAAGHSGTRKETE